MSLTQVADVIVPEIFSPYVQQITEEKARLVQSGVLARDAALDMDLAGGGLTFNAPSWQDLNNDDDNISSDAAADIQSLSNSGGTPALPGSFNDAIPKKIATSQEIAVRLSRNQAWSSADLTTALAGDDPQEAIASRVGYYWARRLQAAFIATMNGVIADNVANDSGDMQVDISGVSFIDGVTNFSAEAFLDAATTMGDSQESLAAVMVHSVVYNRMQKNNLIDFIPDARGEIQIPTFLGREVIVDDGMPRTGGIYDTWLFGMGATRLGVGTPKVPTEVSRQALAGQGGGQEVLSSRTEWSIHPAGLAYVGTSPVGGPSNAGTANNLAAAASWDRVYPERKQIQFARLVTRES